MSISINGTTGISGVVGTASTPALIGTDADTGLYFPTANEIALATAGSQRLLIDSSGNIVIGGTLTSGSFIPTSSTVPTNGIYLSAANTVAVATNGTGRLFVDASGKLGVGTSAPLSQFVVSNAGAAGLEVSPTGFSSAPVILSYNRSGSAYTQLTLDGASNVFAINGTERMRLDASGRLGLGTSTPSGPFHLVGSGNYQARVEASTSINAASLYFGNGSGDFYFGIDSSTGAAIGTGTAYARTVWSQGAYPLVFGTNNTRAITIDTSQRVGVGSTTPSALLHVFNGDFKLSTISTNGSTPATGTQKLVLGGNSSNGVGNVIGWYPHNGFNGDIAQITALSTAFGVSGAGALVFCTNSGIETSPSERARIDSSGRLGVGTTSPTAPLTIVGPDNATQVVIGGTIGSTGRGLRIATALNGSNNERVIFDAQATTGTPDFRWQLAGSEKMGLDSSGRLLVGTSSALTGNSTQYCRVQVAGNTSGTPSGGLIALTRSESATSITADEVLGGVWFGDSGAGEYGSIICQADGTAGTNDYPGRLVFSTTPDGASSPTERMRIDSSGRLGVGTASPGENLSIAGGANLYASLTSTGGIKTALAAADANGFGWVGTTTNHSFSFFANNTERARIDSSGRLLVGTSTSSSTNNAGAGQVQISSETYAVSQIWTHNSAATNAGFFQFGRSRGTKGSPTVVADGDRYGQIDFTGYDGSVYLQGALIRAEVDGTPGANDMPGRLVFSVTRDGSASPTASFQINNQGSCAGFSASDYGIVSCLTQGSSTSKYLFWGARSCTDVNASGGTNVFQVRTDGGIANYSANDVNLSDINTKKDISPAADTWDCLKQWEIVNYRYKDQPDDGDLSLGVIAQQVAESCPEVITVFEEAKDDQPEKLGVKEQQMYWMAIKALQEAQERIESLESENSLQAASLAALDARLSALESA